MRARPAIALLFFFLTFVCCGAAGSRSLPAEVTINKGAGRGELLIVPVRIGTNKEVPFIVDTGSSGTLLDESLEPMLGPRVGTMSMQSWGKTSEHPMYAAPPLSLGGVRLMTADNITTYDFKPDSAHMGIRIKGMLSIDCLKHYCIQLDFEAEKMRFLDPGQMAGTNLGKEFPIVFEEGRPWVVHDGLVEGLGNHTLIDSGYVTDGAIKGLSASYFPERLWEGQQYTNLVLGDGGYVLGLRFLARHLVTLDFPNRKLYLQQRSIGPLPGDMVPFLAATRVEALEPLVKAVINADIGAAQTALATLNKSDAAAYVKAVGRNVEATLEPETRVSPEDAPPSVAELALGDAQPRIAEVGWLKPAANRIPPNSEVQSPLLDSGRLYATGLYAHSPSRYVFELGGKWDTLRGEAGLHTSFQPYAFGVIFVIKTDGKEVFRSPEIRGTTRPHYEVNLRRVNTLELITEQARSRNGGNWALWLEPTLSRRNPPQAVK